MSVFVLTSHPLLTTLSQSAKPEVQDPIAHAELTQELVATCGGVTQARPHPPQFRGSVVVLISQPSLTTLLQFANPPVHDAIPHIELAQKLAATFGGVVHAVQPLQCAGSFRGSTHTLLHAMSGDAHVVEHIPKLQAVPAGQFVPAVPIAFTPQPVVAPQF